MDENKLFNEIACCRAAVRKAKVAVIRKIIKKIKILKTCKLETVKEKKLRKSERLFKKIQIMKKVKDDEVTKFALRHRDLEVFLKGPELDLKLSALACLAKHETVLKKVNSIRHQICNWEREIPILLDSLEKNKEVLKMENNFGKTIVMKKHELHKNDKIDGSSKGLLKPKVNSSKKMQDKHELKNYESEIAANNVSCISEKVKKIEDPFFIEKKVIAPKLGLERLSNKKNNKTDMLQKYLLKKDKKKVLHEKPLKRNQNINQINVQKSVPEKKEIENLHPSWAAKKVKLIKPFQGKKIKFSDD